MLIGVLAIIDIRETFLSIFVSWRLWHFILNGENKLFFPHQLHQKKQKIVFWIWDNFFLDFWRGYIGIVWYLDNQDISVAFEPIWMQPIPGLLEDW